MAARGPYAKGKAKRAEILDTALRVIAEQGYSGATVKQLADAVGLSQNGLLHYFGSKDNLFLEILESIATRPPRSRPTTSTATLPANWFRASWTPSTPRSVRPA